MKKVQLRLRVITPCGWQSKQMTIYLINTPLEEDVMMLQANAKEIAINKVLLKQQGSLDQKRIPSGGELVSGLPLHEGELGDETGGNTKVFRKPHDAPCQ